MICTKSSRALPAACCHAETHLLGILSCDMLHDKFYNRWQVSQIGGLQSFHCYVQNLCRIVAVEIKYDLCTSAATSPSMIRLDKASMIGAVSNGESVSMDLKSEDKNKILHVDINQPN